MSYTYIYGLADPLTSRIHYVGKSNDPDKRLTQHLKENKSRRTKKGRWIRSLTAKNLTPQLVILEKVPRSKWQGAERWWIAELKRQGHPLTNIAPGGVYIPKRRPSTRQP